MEIRRVSIHSFILDQKLKKDGQGRNSNSATFKLGKEHIPQKNTFTVPKQHTHKREILASSYTLCVSIPTSYSYKYF